MSEHRLLLKAASKEVLHPKAKTTLLTHLLPIEHKNGYVFVLGELDPGAKVGKHILEILRTCSEQFASNLKREGNIQHRFEQYLQQLNTQLQEEVLDIQQSKVHIVTGAVLDTTFILSALGRPQATFLRKTAKHRFRVYDLSHSLATETGKITQEKLFGVVLDGTLQAEDVLFFGSRESKQLFTMDDIQSILTTLPPTSALQQLEAFLPLKKAVNLLHIQVLPERIVPVGIEHEVTSSASMYALHGTQNRTRAMLEDEHSALNLNLSRIMRAFKEGKGPERVEAAQSIFIWLLRVTKTAGLFLLLLLSNSLFTIATITLAAVNRRSRRTAAQEIKKTWKHTFNPQRRRNNPVHLSGKMLAVGLCICLILFCGLILVQRSRKQARLEQEQFNQTMEEVSERIAEAEARIIYKDESGARAILAQVEQELSGLEETKEDRLQAIQERQDLLTSVTETLRKVVETPTTSLSYNGKTFHAMQGQALVFTDGSIDLINKNTLSPFFNGNSFAVPKDLTVHNDALIQLSSDETIQFLNQNAEAPQDVEFFFAEQAQQTIKDMIHYGERLYLLTSNQIYRHQRLSPTAYSQPASWLLEDVDLSQLNYMAIDGTIWLAGNTSLRRFESGREIGSITTNIDPPLSRIMGLWTSDETDTLYILDSGLGRVLAINKVTAEVLAQYQDERFKSGQGLYVDAGTIYVATDQELLSFSEQNR